MAEPPLRAVIYTPPGVDVERWHRACLKHCAKKGYTVVSLVNDDPALTHWRDVVRLCGNEADVVVVASMAAVSPYRIPRIEEPPAFDTAGIAVRRRPKRFRLRDN